MVVQKVLVIVAVLSVPVLLLGKPMQEYISHRMKRTQLSVSTASEFSVCAVCVCLYITALSSCVGRQTSSAGRKRLYKCSPGRGGYERRRRGGKRETEE